MTLSEELSNTNFLKNFYKIKNRGPDNSSICSFPINNQVLKLGFHRLAFNDLTSNGNQPFIKNDICLMCNGEIYNYNNLKQYYKFKNFKSDSDCEIIIDLFLYFDKDFNKVLNNLDGVYSIILFDIKTNKIYIARDKFGVRSLYIGKSKDIEIGVSSQLDALNHLNNVEHFPPNSYAIIENNLITYHKLNNHLIQYKTFAQHLLEVDATNINASSPIIYKILDNAVKKRIYNLEEKQVGCLLSGGLDSSIIAYLLKQYFPNLKTFSIGFQNSPDLKSAELVSKYLKTNHTSVLITPDEAISNIKEVIKITETYDTTTIRASTPMYILCNKIKTTNPDINVIFSGEGADEVFGGYKYISTYKKPKKFQEELLNLQNNIHFFDGLRADKCIASNKMEARLPFLDKTFVNYINSITPKQKESHTKLEKLILRNAFKDCLPDEIIYRKKEAFSDGISPLESSWHKILLEYSSKLHNNFNDFKINPPKTYEEKWYRNIFETYFPNRGNIIPFFWKQKINGKENIDPSAREIRRIY